MAPYEDLRADETTLPVISGRAAVLGAGPTGPLDGWEAGAAVYGVLVAGHGFGAGDPGAAGILRRRGVAAVIAPSFAPRFLRHATACGLPALVIEEAPAIQTGDRLRVDVEAHVVANLSSGDRYVVRNIDDAELVVLRRTVAAAA